MRQAGVLRVFGDKVSKIFYIVKPLVEGVAGEQRKRRGSHQLEHEYDQLRFCHHCLSLLDYQLMSEDMDILNRVNRPFNFSPHLKLFLRLLYQNVLS